MTVAVIGGFSQRRHDRRAEIESSLQSPESFDAIKTAFLHVELIGLVSIFREIKELLLAGVQGRCRDRPRALVGSRGIRPPTDAYRAGRGNGGKAQSKRPPGGIGMFVADSEGDGCVMHIEGGDDAALWRMNVNAQIRRRRRTQKSSFAAVGFVRAGLRRLRADGSRLIPAGLRRCACGLPKRQRPGLKVGRQRHGTRPGQEGRGYIGDDLQAGRRLSVLDAEGDRAACRSGGLDRRNEPWSAESKIKDAACIGIGGIGGLR